MPFFSVIIPVYNRAHRLPYVLESLKKQTFQDFETIIVDDASTDDSYQVAMDYELPNKIVLRNEQNCERCVTRNRGIDVANGQYFCFLDSDDYHLPEHFQKLYDFIVSKGNPEAFFFTNLYAEMEDGTRTIKECPNLDEYDPYFYFLRYTVNPQRWAVHRTIMQHIRFDENVVIAEDMDVSLRIVAAGYPIFQFKEEYTVYVSASDSFTHGDPNKITKELFYFRRIIQKKELKGKLPKRAVRYFISQCYYHMAQQCFDSQKRWLTWKYSIKSFCLFPQGYDDNFRNNKILLVICIYSIPMLGNVIKNFHQRNMYER